MKSVQFSKTLKCDRDFEIVQGIYDTKRRINVRLNDLQDAQVKDRKHIERINKMIVTRTKLDKLASKNPDKVMFSYRNKKEDAKK